MKKVFSLLLCALFAIGEINAQEQLNERSTCNLATPMLTVSDSIICSNDSAQICAPVGFASYHWNTGDTRMCIETDYSYVYYKVTVTDANNCTAVSDSVMIRVYPTADLLIEEGDTLAVFGAISYQWYRNDSVIPGAINNVYVTSYPGYYSVLTTDTNGCATLYSPVYITGIKELNDEATISIYPNPCSVTNMQLLVGNELIGGTFTVSDGQGRLVFQSKILELKSEIPANELPSGVYFLRIFSANTSLTRKLIKL